MCWDYDINPILVITITLKWWVWKTTVGFIYCVSTYWIRENKYVMKISLSLICCCYSWHCFYLCWTRKSSFFVEVHECIDKRMGYIGQTNSTKSFWVTYAKKIGYFRMLEKIIVCILSLDNNTLVWSHWLIRIKCI